MEKHKNRLHRHLDVEEQVMGAGVHKGEESIEKRICIKKYAV